MPITKSHRRPALPYALAAFLPSFVAVLIAIWIPRAWEGFALLPLLVGATLSMAAVCHATGIGCEPTFARAVLRRGPAHLIVLAIYTAIVFALTAWPLLVLSHGASLATALGLAATLAVAVAVLWRAWPVFGLVFEWADAFPASAEHSWITAAITRSFRFARHLTQARDLFFTHLLPAALAQLAITFGALTLAGMGADLPDEIRTAALFLYAVVLLPLCSLVVANRTFKLLLGASSLQPVPPTAPIPPGGRDAHRESAAGTAGETSEAAPQPEGDSVVEPPVPQASLDRGLLDSARGGDVDAALAWLQRGADPNATPSSDTRDQRPALLLAAILPDTRLLRELIARGADPNLAHGGMTALLMAARDGCRDSAEALLVLVSNGADPAVADADGNTALHYVARSLDPGSALTLIDAGAPLDACNQRRRAPLCVAARAANWPMFDLLLQRGASAQARFGEPPLVAAAGPFGDDPHGVLALLRRKVEIDARDGGGRTALMEAAREGHLRISRALIEAHADVNLVDEHGTTALMEAARSGADGVVSALGSAGAAPGLRDRHDRDALTLACQSPHAHASTVLALMALGADPRAAGSDGRCALDYATVAGRWDLVAILDPDHPLPACLATPASPDPDAATPAHLLDALRFGHWTMVSSFASRAREWPPATLAGLYLELCGAEHRAAREWLLDHGLDAEATLDGGVRLFEALLDRLPESIDALDELRDAGASVSGAGVLARALSRLRASAPGARFVMRMLAGGADAFGADPAGRAPLHYCDDAALEPVQRELLARGADANARDHHGNTPLHLVLQAARARKSAPEDAAELRLVRNLIAGGADAEAADATGETPLGVALMTGDRGLERWLDWPHWPLPGRRLRADDLPAAATAGDVAAIDKLLELGFPVDAIGHDGTTALIAACARGHASVATRLLDAHADGAAHTPDGTTALAAAACAGHVALVDLLAERGVPVDERLPGDTTALLLVSALGHAAPAAALLAAGADVHASDAHQRTALHAAAHFCFSSNDSLRCRRLLDALLEHHVDVNRIDEKGNTPIGLLLGARASPGVSGNETHLAALLPSLLDAGADVAHADDRGVTPLHACAMHALFAPARLLLAHGADRTAKDCMGRTAADVARALGLVDLAPELEPRQAGAPTMRVAPSAMTSPGAAP